MKVLCVTGMPGCGKEEFLRVAAEMGFSVVRMGDVVREEALRRGLPITDAAVGGMAHAERQAHGFGVWAERILPRIRGDPVLVDGLRGRAAGEREGEAIGAKSREAVAAAHHRAKPGRDILRPLHLVVLERADDQGEDGKNLDDDGGEARAGEVAGHLGLAALVAQLLDELVEGFFQAGEAGGRLRGARCRQVGGAFLWLRC